MDECQALYENAEIMHKHNKTNIVICIIIMLSLIAISIFKNGNAVSIKVDGDNLIFNGPANSGFSTKIPLDSITDIEIIENFDSGRLISGADTGVYQYGTWENEELKEYQLSINKNVLCVLKIETSESTFVLNYESEATTKAFAEGLIELLYTEKYWK